MKALRLAISFIRVPKLFASLLLWPLLVGLFIGLGQLIISAKYIQFVTSDGSELRANELRREGTEQQFFRALLFGDDKELAPIRVCIWHKTPTGEAAPDDCPLRATDVVIHTSELTPTDTARLVDFYSGSSERIHFCQSCESGITVEFSAAGTPETTIRNLEGLMVLLLGESNRARDIFPIYGEAKEKINHLKQAEGKVYLIPEGLGERIFLSEATTTMILIVNVSFIVIVALWLALRAHRKVLDYFIRNDALLPMVAACGKNTFYLSLWIITALRVSFFLLASVIITAVVFRTHVPDETLQLFIGDADRFLLWVLGIMASLSVSAIIASIGELQHRHSFVSFLYKYVPTILCFAGTVVWAVSLFVNTPAAKLIQTVIASTPVLGLSAIILAPMIKVPENVLIANALLSSVLALIVLRLNARWFAAHLEDL